MARQGLGKSVISSVQPPAEVVPDLPMVDEELDTYLPEPDELEYEDTLFDENAPPPVIIPPTQVVATRNDFAESIDEEQKAREELAKLLNAAMPLADRVKQLVKLAKFTDTKRAPVGLRALQTINELTGVSADKPMGATPMFQLPPDTSVSVVVEKVSK